MSGSGAASGPSLPLRSLLPAGPRPAQGKPRGAEDRGTPVFLSAAAAFKLAVAQPAGVLQDKQEFKSRPRPHNVYPAPPDRRARRNGAHRLLAAGGLGPSPCGTGFGMLLHCFEKADIQGLLEPDTYRIAPKCEGASIRHPTGASIANRDRSMGQLGSVTLRVTEPRRPPARGSAESADRYPLAGGYAWQFNRFPRGMARLRRT